MPEYLSQTLNTERLQVFAYLHRKWRAAKTPAKVVFYHDEMAEEVRAMTAREAAIAHKIMQEGCRVDRDGP